MSAPFSREAIILSSRSWSGPTCVNSPHIAAMKLKSMVEGTLMARDG